MRNDPMKRLASVYRVEIDPKVEERHLAEVSTALRLAPPPAPPGLVGRRRRTATALAAAALVLAPAAMAVAAEEAIPGDALYPVKQVTERIRTLVDDDIVATHRVEELERLIKENASFDVIDDTAGRAAVAVSELDEPGELGARLERAREGVRDRDQIRDSEGPDPALPDSETAEPGDGPSTPGSGSTIAPRPDRESSPGSGSVGPGTGGADRNQSGSSDEGGEPNRERSRESGAGAGSGNQSAEKSNANASDDQNGSDLPVGSGPQNRST